MVATAPPQAAKEIALVDLRSEYAEIAHDVRSAIDRVLERGDFVLGEDVRLFEEEYAAWCGVRACVGVSDGTDALHLALRALGIGAGDEVITSPNSFIASASAITMAGATPVFADIDAHTYTLDPDAVEQAITARTRAILPVHLYGQMANMPALLGIAQRHGLHVVEDACQAHGAELLGRRAGAWGDAAAFSFYPAKNLGAYGDGGAVVTNNPKVAERVRMLRDYGQRQKYHHDFVAYNSRLDTIHAAVLRVKLRHLEQWNRSRLAAADIYDKLLADIGLKGPARVDGGTHVFHLYVITLKDREAAFTGLRQMGIGVGMHYPIPIHLQRAYSELNLAPGTFPKAEFACTHCLTLPMHPFLTKHQQECVVEAMAALDIENACAER